MLVVAKEGRRRRKEWMNKEEQTIAKENSWHSIEAIHNCSNKFQPTKHTHYHISTNIKEGERVETKLN